MRHTLTNEELFCLEGCRSYEQYRHMRQRFEDGICTFCDLDLTVNKIVWEDGHVRVWSVLEAFPRAELLHHFIICPVRHVRFEAELDDYEVLSVAKAHRLLKETYKFNGGIVATRFGDMSLNAGTVPHLHINVMVPNGTGEVRIPVYKDPGDREKNRLRAAEFAAQYMLNELP